VPCRFSMMPFQASEQPSSVVECRVSSVECEKRLAPARAMPQRTSGSPGHSLTGMCSNVSKGSYP